MGRDRQMFSSNMAKLEFPRFFGDGPIKWFNRVDQFFEFQGVTDAQKVSLASLQEKDGFASKNLHHYFIFVANSIF